MNILYTMFSFNVGGIERLLIDIIKNWKSEEDNIHVCIINNDYNEGILNDLKKIKNINLILLEREKGGDIFYYQKKYFKYIREHKINIIHCQSMSSLKFTVPYKLFNRNVKIFHTVHDTNTYKKYSKLEVKIDKYFTKKIIAISNSVKKEILDKGIEESKITVIYNGICKEKFKPRERKIEDNSIKIGCVARLDYKKKGQDVLIKAISILKDEFPNIKCFLAGECNKDSKEQKNELLELANELEVSEKIIFLGNVDKVSELLKNIDIFVLPSRYEGFGIALIEAMFSKVMVISSDIDGPKEIIENNKYGYLFEMGNHYDLACKIKSVIKTYDKNKIEDAYKNAIEKYDINIMVEKIKLIYSL